MYFGVSLGLYLVNCNLWLGLLVCGVVWIGGDLVC